MQIFWTGTCDCPARKMSAPILDNVKAMDIKLQETKPQDLYAKDSKSEDANAEEKSALHLESVNRFDGQKPIMCVEQSSYNQNTNTQNNVTHKFKASVLFWFFFPSFVL